MSVSNVPWVYEKRPKHQLIEPYNVGKWMLFCHNSLLDELWLKAVELYNDEQLHGVISMKCSTNYDNLRASNKHEGIVIFYCNKSYEATNILQYGHNILEKMQFTTGKVIYYKTDAQTSSGTRATGQNHNHAYEIKNPLYRHPLDVCIL